MNIEEALKELLAGKKIRRRGWESKSYNIEDGCLKLGGNWCMYLSLTKLDLIADDWEIVKENILNKREKEYLENLIKPFVKKFYKITIVKNEGAVTGRSYIVIKLYSDDYIDTITLPYFEKDDHMYTGMECKKNYTIDELGLFKK